MSTPVQTPPVPPVLAENDARNWAMFAHLSTLVGMVIPFGNIFAPLIIMMTKGKESPLVDDQAKEALNFQLTWTLITFALAITIIGILCLIPYVLFDIILRSWPR